MNKTKQIRELKDERDKLWRVAHLILDELDELKILVKHLINVKRLADGQISTFSVHGQAMDGYTELAEYRAIIAKLEAVGGVIMPPRNEH